MKITIAVGFDTELLTQPTFHVSLIFWLETIRWQ